ncbi:hypothetical protein QOT17_022188 [Balamuthia mandrillaris]
MMSFIGGLHDYDANGSTSTPHSSHTFTMFSLSMTGRSSAVVRKHKHTSTRTRLEGAKGHCRVSKGLVIRKKRTWYRILNDLRGYDKVSSDNDDLGDILKSDIDDHDDDHTPAFIDTSIHT